MVYFTSGKPEERLRIARHRLEMAEKKEDRLTIADTLAQIGVDAELAGRYGEAEEKYKEALPIFEEYGDKWHHTEYLLRLASMAFFKGNFKQARSLTEEGQTAVKRYNLLSVIPHVIEHLAIILCAEEDYERAIEVSVKPKLHFYPLTVFALYRGLAYGHCGLGNISAARENLGKTLEVAIPLKASGWFVQCLPAAALIAAAEERLKWATELLALAFHHPAGATAWMEKFPLIIRLRERLGMEMGSEMFAAAWEKGKGLDLETAVSQVRAAMEAGTVEK